MSMQQANQTQQENERIIELSGLDLDYSALEDQFKDLTMLAARIAGTGISLVNLIDSYTQWTVSRYGITMDQMPREESICDYTIRQPGFLEVKDLSVDDRFKNRHYVTGELGLRYYFGVPLQTPSGHNLGALCVLDRQGKEISPENKELLRIIANEIVGRLMTLKTIRDLRMQVREANEARRRLAHDIRGPLGGIMGLTGIIAQQGNTNRMEDMLEFNTLIQKSSNSLLELAEDILGADKQPQADTGTGAGDYEYTLTVFKQKLGQLYGPLAVNKKLRFDVTAIPGNETVPFARTKLLQIAGNLISNAMKFTPGGGSVMVELDLQPAKLNNTLIITVTDNGVGMPDDTFVSVNGSHAPFSAQGTDGEKGYGFGLSLVEQLVTGMNGTITVQSQADTGTAFRVELPMKRI